MQVVITGGTGFIGSNLSLKCRDLGYDVTSLGLVRTQAQRANADFLASRGIRVLQVSVTDLSAVSKVLGGAELVFHLAAVQHEANVPDQTFWDVNVTGTENVLRACAAAGARRCIHASTIGVYGHSKNGAINEGSPLKPDDVYGRSKLEGERLALAPDGATSVVVLRISETYGPRDQRLLKLFKAINKGAFLVIGDGNNLHHPIFVDDLVDAMLLAAEVKCSPNSPIVLAGPEPVSTNEMVRIIADQLGKRVPRLHAPFPFFKSLAYILENTLSPIGVQPPIHRRRLDFFRKSFAFSTHQMEELLGFSPEVDFPAGVARTVRFYTDNGYLS